MPSTRLLYGATAFLSAFLLFVVEPLAAKQLLPVLGGASAVWLTCLVFFQITLLAGYLYAHWLCGGQRAGNQFEQWRIHVSVIVLALIALAANLTLSSAPDGSAYPVLTIFWTLTRTIGLPFLLLASTSPLLQTWLAERERTATGAPGPVWYRLFALSNAGSLLALIAYPTLIEPNLALRSQRTLWYASFVLYALLAYTIASQPRTAVVSSPHHEDAPPSSAKIRWLWFLLPMAAAMQLSAITAHLTINIAAIPLLWVLPLAVYLITFIIAFDRPALYHRPIVVRLLVVMLASLGLALSKTDLALPVLLAITFYLVECFVACLFCHGETSLLRPLRSPETTLFYLLIAAGGAAGTFLVGIAFPLLFRANYDLALAFFATAALALAATWNDGWAQRLLWTTASILLLALGVMLHISYGRQTLASVRNFYGTLRVKQADAPAHHVPMRVLLHGTIHHGTQLFSPELSHTPTTYYATDSGVGLALRFCCSASSATSETRGPNDPVRITNAEPYPRNIGVIGLGAGTLAAYGQPGDRIQFYEINPQVAPIARNLFTYLRDSPAAITITPGDARTSLAHQSPQNFDVLVVDAFSGDAIPLHLLTTQAIRLYQSHLAPTGILAFHVSNQYLDLAPELRLLAEAAHLEARDVSTPANDERGEYRAEWVLMTNDPTFFTQPELATFADPIMPMPYVRLWTDDYSSLLPLLRLGDH